VGQEQVRGRETGAAFIYPNPVRNDRYVVVMAGVDGPGMLRAMSLPDLLPDYVVWDERLANSRDQLVLGGGSVRAAGFFTKEWDLGAVQISPEARATDSWHDKDHR
jgi:hypothetical protein